MFGLEDAVLRVYRDAAFEDRQGRVELTGLHGNLCQPEHRIGVIWSDLQNTGVQLAGFVVQTVCATLLCQRECFVDDTVERG